MAEFNKYKDKPKQVVIDGVTVVEGSADWEAFSCKWRYYRFLEALTRNPDEQNPLDCIDWANYWPEVHAILKEWKMVDMPKDWYKIAAQDYMNMRFNGYIDPETKERKYLPAYKNKIHGFGWFNPKTKEFTVDPVSVKG